MGALGLLLVPRYRSQNVAASRTGGESTGRIGGPWLHGVVEAQSIQVGSRQITQTGSIHVVIKSSEG